MTQPTRIMIVEDDAFIALDLEDVFEAEGYEVVGVAANVDTALAMLREKELDVAILDYNLGVETSIPIAHKLDEMGVPFLFLSGQTRQVVLSETRDDPVVLSKPFVPSHLINSMQALTNL